MKFQFGDRVKRGVHPLTCDAKVPVGTPGTVVDIVNDCFRVQFDNGGIANCSPHYLAPHVDTFPIPADKDPWKASEPNAAPFEHECAASSRLGFECSRSANHRGHHVARGGAAGVCDRWPQSAPPAEKSGPAVGTEVVRTLKHIELADLPVGARGVVMLADERRFSVDFRSPAHRRVDFLVAYHWGTLVVPAAEWDASQRRDTTPCPAPFIIQSQRATGVGEPKLMVPCSLPQMARALFDHDHELIALRLCDPNHDGNGKQAFLDRAWERASAEKLGEYEWKAAVVLKRAGELP